MLALPGGSVAAGGKRQAEAEQESGFHHKIAFCENTLFPNEAGNFFFLKRNNYIVPIYKTSIAMNDNEYYELLKHVVKLASELTLSDLYRVPADCPFLPKEARERIVQKETFYEKNLQLKMEVSQFLNGCYDKNDYDIAFWIINKWGGINKFKKNDDNKQKIESFFKGLPAGNANLERISSLSKVASFTSPLEYFIYDSRVAYSLNWLLLKSGVKSGFFKKPQGLNKRLNHIPIETVIMKTVGTDIVYHKDQETYSFYNQLILRLFQDIKKRGIKYQYPFEIEMLLFQAAPSVIYEEIKKQYSVELEEKDALPSISYTKAQGPTEDLEIDLTYRNTNGRALIYPRYLSDKIKNTQRYGKVYLQIDGQEILIKHRDPDYQCFRQSEINNWAKQKEEKGTLKDTDSVSAILLFTIEGK